MARVVVIGRCSPFDAGWGSRGLKLNDRSPAEYEKRHQDQAIAALEPVYQRNRVNSNSRPHLQRPLSALGIDVAAS